MQFSENLSDEYANDEFDSAYTRHRAHDPSHPDDVEFETIPEEQGDFDGAQHVNGFTDDIQPPPEQLSPGMVEEEEITVEQVIVVINVYKVFYFSNVFTRDSI